MLFAGFEGTRINPDLEELIVDQRVGGGLLVGRSPVPNQLHPMLDEDLVGVVTETGMQRIQPTCCRGVSTHFKNAVFFFLAPCGGIGPANSLHCPV